MKFTKYKAATTDTNNPFSEESDAMSIVWNHSNGAYTYQEGVTVGLITLDSYAETLQLLSQGLTDEILANFRLNNLKKEEIRLRDYQIVNHKYTPGDFYDIEVVLEQSKNQLPYGVFEMTYGPRSETLFKPYNKPVENVTLIKNKNLKEQVIEFFNNKTETGRKNKKGFLLYGNPGNGKSTEIMSLFDICQELKLRIFIIESEFSLKSMKSARDILKDENCIFVLEEITERLNKRGLEEILTFLDGETSWSNCITIATTNYPHEMPANLVDRPGRFEEFIEYNNPTREEITTLGAAFNYTEEQVSSLFGQGLSFDYVSFILSQSVKLGLPVKETRDKEEQKRKRLSETFKGKIGF